MSQVASPIVQTEVHSARYYVSESSGYKYLLPADDEERQRLDGQSCAINQSFGNKFIWAPVTLKDGDTVLDSGSGSGHWLLSLAKELPRTINLCGIDISTRMLPSNPPSNISFTQNTITSLPKDWSNTFTLINQRLLVVALQAPQWKAALSEMYRTLIPGGYVQLFELAQAVKSPSKEVRDHKAWMIRDKFCHEVRHIVMDITNHLQSWLEQCGFINVTMVKRELPMGAWGGEHGTRGLKALMDFFPAIRGPVLQEGGLGLVSSGEEYDALVDDLTKRCEATPESYVEYYLFIAQKPVV